jgi:transcriptional regulator with XRE-family HTH domain
MAEVFSPERLRLARQRRGLLGQELATRLNVTRRSVTSWENGSKTPNDDNVSSLASTLDYPRGYFYLDAPPLLEGGTFRSLARMTAKQASQATAAGAQAVELDNWITAHYRRPEPRLPDLRDVEPETAAEALRADWGIGFRPLPNLVHLMEKNGIRVYSLVHGGIEVDAYSAWCGNTPFVFLNTIKTPERSRMDASHELGPNS